jgi:hypothetical protein
MKRLRPRLGPGLRPRLLKLATLVAGSALFWACTAPVFPVPPPGSISFTSAVVTDNANSTTKTVWTGQGGPLEQAANATYYLLNRTMGTGVITTAHNDGSFTTPDMDGNQGDQVLVYYKTPVGDYSDSACVLLAPGPASVCPDE